MIASAVVEFSEDMSDEVLAAYAAQVHSEFESLTRLVAEAGLDLEIGPLGEIQAEVERASPLRTWGLVAREADRILKFIDEISGSDAAPTT